MWNTLTDDERDIILEATAFGIQAEDAVKLLRLNEEDSIALLKDPELHREAEIALIREQMGALQDLRGARSMSGAINATAITNWLARTNRSTSFLPDEKLVSMGLDDVDEEKIQIDIEHYEVESAFPQEG